MSFCLDGVILIDPEYVKDRKVFAQVLAAFRYGREDLDMLGLAFRKDLFISSLQVYPPISDNKLCKPLKDVPLTQLQDRLLKKLGPNAYPFYFQARYVLASVYVGTIILTFNAFSRPCNTRIRRLMPKTLLRTSGDVDY